MDASKPESDVNELLARMQKVRASGYSHAGELHGEAKRLVDWKEYVRSRPLTSIAVASLVGFSIVRSAFAANAQTDHRPVRGNGCQQLQDACCRKHQARHVARLHAAGRHDRRRASESVFRSCFLTSDHASFSRWSFFFA